MLHTKYKIATNFKKHSQSPLALAYLSLRHPPPNREGRAAREQRHGHFGSQVVDGSWSTSQEES